MKPSQDFRAYVQTMDDPRTAARHGRDIHQHAQAGPAIAFVQDLLFKPRGVPCRQPLAGVTTGGAALPGMFSRGPNGAPAGAVTACATRLRTEVPADERGALALPFDAREWRRQNNTEMSFHPQYADEKAGQWTWA